MSQDDTRGAGREFLDSLAKGLELLSLFDERQRSFTVQGAADALGCTRAAARRILMTLAELGHLRQDGREFRLTPAVLELGYRYFRTLGVAGAVRPVLESLSGTFSCGAALGILADADVLFIERVEAVRAIKLDLRAGDRLPAHGHSLGRALLAHLPDDRLDAHLPLAANGRPALAGARRRALTDELARIRAQGWSFCNGELVTGLFGVGMPVADEDGRVRYAINVTSIGQPWPDGEIAQSVVPALREAARLLTPLLGKLG